MWEEIKIVYSNKHVSFLWKCAGCVCIYIKKNPACLWGVHYMGYSVCMHIINTCAVWQRCESESFSTKWSARRERNKEICSCQGSVRQRLLLEIFWKNHTFEGLVLCCLRISSSDQWKSEKRRTWVGEFWCWDGHGTSAVFFFLGGEASLFKRGRLFCSYIKTCITQLKQQCL